MLTSKRLARLGSGVFDRNDQRKRSVQARGNTPAATADRPLPGMH